MKTETSFEQALKSPCRLIGQDRLGRWVVRDTRRLRSRIFVERAEAIRFAMFESMRSPQSVIMMPYGLDSDVVLDDVARDGLKTRCAA